MRERHIEKPEIKPLLFYYSWQWDKHPDTEYFQYFHERGHAIKHYFSIRRLDWQHIAMWSMVTCIDTEFSTKEMNSQKGHIAEYFGHNEPDIYSIYSCSFEEFLKFLEVVKVMKMDYFEGFEETKFRTQLKDYIVTNFEKVRL